MTYRSEEDTDSILSSFRNDYYPRIAVTVDMIATGTDVKPLEILLFMRDVPLKDLLQGVAMGSRDEETVLSLANRLVRLSKQLDAKAQARIAKISGGSSVADLAKGLISSVDPDEVVKMALSTAQADGKARTEETLTDLELASARTALVAQACAPFDKPELRDGIESARREREQILDHLNLDAVTQSGFSDQVDANAHKTIQTFLEFIAAHKDDLEAISFFYQQPYQRRTLTYAMIDELQDRLSRPPLMLTTEKLWGAYARIQSVQVGGFGRQRQLSDLVALVRFAMGMDQELKPFRDQVDKRFQEWIFRHNAQRTTAFTPEQTEWLRLMKDHIASSCSIERKDFDYADFARRGGLQKAWADFGASLDPLMDELNLEMVA